MVRICKTKIRFCKIGNDIYDNKYNLCFDTNRIDELERDKEMKIKCL